MVGWLDFPLEFKGGLARTSQVVGSLRARDSFCARRGRL
jgi:hypothetical protein